MMRLPILAFALVLASTTAHAEKVPWLPSKAEVVQQSLDQLLNNGWELLQGSLGYDGFVVTLRKQSDVVLCEFHPRGEGGTGRSRCYKLN